MMQNNRFYAFIIAYEEFLNKYEWSVSGTLTTPFSISSNAIGNAVSRMEKMISKNEHDYRFFAVSEPFNDGGYHLHFIGWIEGLNTTEAIKVFENNWQKAIGVARRPYNKCNKYKKDSKCIPYILKYINNKKINYYLGGRKWR
jgi:hypothetical protein